jgi:hypothetical protein
MRSSSVRTADDRTNGKSVLHGVRGTVVIDGKAV